MQDLPFLSFSEQFSQETKKKHPRPSTNAAAAVWKAKNAPAKRTANTDVTKMQKAVAVKMPKPDATVRKMQRPAIVKMLRLVTADAKTAKIANARITRKIWT